MKEGVSAGRRAFNVKHRVIRGTQGKPLPLLPSGPGGVCSRLLHGARHLTTSQFSTDLAVSKDDCARARSHEYLESLRGVLSTLIRVHRRPILAAESSSEKAGI